MPPPARVGGVGARYGRRRTRWFAVSSTIETDAKARLAEVVGAHNLLAGDEVGEDYGHDETLQVEPAKPAYVAKPGTAEEVAELLATASELRIPVTARGSATGLSAAARPVDGGLVISVERMNRPGERRGGTEEIR